MKKHAVKVFDRELLMLNKNLAVRNDKYNGKSAMTKYIFDYAARTMADNLHNIRKDFYNIAIVGRSIDHFLEHAPPSKD